VLFSVEMTTCTLFFSQWWHNISSLICGYHWDVLQMPFVCASMYCHKRLGSDEFVTGFSVPTFRWGTALTVLLSTGAWQI